MIGLCFPFPASCSSCTFCGEGSSPAFVTPRPMETAASTCQSRQRARGRLWTAFPIRGWGERHIFLPIDRCAPPVEAIAEPAMAERRPAIVPLRSLTCHQLSRFHRAVLAFARARRGRGDADSAAIRAASGGALIYTKNSKPALGPFASLDDMGPL